MDPTFGQNPGGLSRPQPDGGPAVCQSDNQVRSLDTLAAGESGTIVKVTHVGAVTRRIVDMGMVKGTEVEVIKAAPFGDPIEVKTKGCNISLRRAEAATVWLRVGPRTKDGKRPPGQTSGSNPTVG